MDRNELKRLVKREPFVPFLLHLDSGLDVPVMSGDHIMLHPRANVVYLFTNENTYSVNIGAVSLIDDEEWAKLYPLEGNGGEGVDQ